METDNKVHTTDQKPATDDKSSNYRSRTIRKYNESIKKSLHYEYNQDNEENDDQGKYDDIEESAGSTVKFNHSDTKYDNYLDQKELEDTINDMQSVSFNDYSIYTTMFYICNYIQVLTN